LFGATFYSNGSYSLTTGWSTSYQYLYATLHHGHTYEVQVYILATAYVSVYSATASAAASFNLGGSHGVTLESVSVV
ncbi:MAG TPA: hypothetical protein VEY07_02115, partial [Thermoplasmata archaeon]|nr:hypothetical protein [Thermoplasmata archaeon]